MAKRSQTTPSPKLNSIPVDAADLIRKKHKLPNGDLPSLLGRTSIGVQQTRDALPFLLAQSQLTPVEQREVWETFSDELSRFASRDEIRQLCSESIVPLIMLCRQRGQWAESFKVVPAAATVTPPKKRIPKQGVSLRSAAEVLSQRGEGTTDDILMRFRKFSHEFQSTGFALKPKNKPLFSVQTMAALIVKCGFADSTETASQNLKTKLEDCQDS